MSDNDIPIGGPLSDDELEKLAELVARYTYHHVDQWEFWKVDLPHGSDYVCLSTGGPLWESDYDQIDWRFYSTIWPRRRRDPASPPASPASQTPPEADA